MVQPKGLKLFGGSGLGLGLKAQGVEAVSRALLGLITMRSSGV